MTTSEELSFTSRFIPNLIAFFIGLALAWFLRWETGDLVWSLWLSSLVIGYATILISIFCGAGAGVNAINDKEFSLKHRLLVVLGGFVMALFPFVFFSFHFCGFHSIHSVFLSIFFPLEGLPDDGFGDAFMNPLLLWKSVFEHLMVPYGLFLIPAIIAERKAILKPLRLLRDDSVDESSNDKKTGSGKQVDELFVSPYRNVFRMHILIFFFAASHLLKLDSFAVYVVVSAVYFFPWSDLKAFRSKQEH